MNIRKRVTAWKDASCSSAMALGGAFWMRWSVCALLLLIAMIAGGASFFMIGLGGLLGCICAVMLDAFAEFRVENGKFLVGNACMGLLSFTMSNIALYYPSRWSLILGCLVSSGLLLALLLRRLDRETGMNIQVGIWLAGVAASLILAFVYTGPYAGAVVFAAYMLSVGLYVWLLIVLREGTETGLRAAWYLALGIGLSVLTATAFNLLAVVPSGGILFGGFVVGLIACSLLSPLKRVTCWITCKLDEEKKPDW